MTNRLKFQLLLRPPNVRLWPILLKNSVLEADEKTLAPQLDLKFFDMRGQQVRSKIRYQALGKVRRENAIGLCKWLAFSRKSAPPRFGVFQQNRPKADIRD